MIDPESIAFDIDGVFADTIPLVIEIARDEFGIDGIRPEDITCYALRDCLDIDGEIIEAVIKKLLDGNYSAKR